MDFNSLKKCRFVCKKWAFESAKKFNFHDFCIWLAPNRKYFDQDCISPGINLQNLVNFQAFVARHNLIHIVNVSFLNPSWLNFYPCADEDKQEYGKMTDAYNSIDNIHDPIFSSEILNHLSLESTSNLLYELRLEINLRNGEDAKLLEDIFSRLIKLKRLALDIVNWEDDGFLSLTTGVPPNTIQSLGLRIHEVSM